MAEWCNYNTTIECFFQPLGKCTHYISDNRGTQGGKYLFMMRGKQAPLWIPGDEDNDEQVLRLRCRSSVEYRNWIPDELAIEVAKVIHLSLKVSNFSFMRTHTCGGSVTSLTIS